MASRFFYTSLARRPLTFGGKVFKFDVFSLNGGAASGVYETSDPEEIRLLDDAVQGRRGVRTMSESEGETAKKKAASLPRSSNFPASQARVIQPPILPQLSVEERPGVPSAGKPSGVTPEQNLLSGPHANRPSIGNLLKLGKVNPPKPFAESHAKTAKAVKRADNAKIRVIRGSEGSAK